MFTYTRTRVCVMRHQTYVLNVTRESLDNACACVLVRYTNDPNNPNRIHNAKRPNRWGP
jgi:hypothetical protein